MKRTSFALLGAALLAAWIGCQSATEPLPTKPADESTTMVPASEGGLTETGSADRGGADTGLTYVNVPGMV